MTMRLRHSVVCATTNLSAPFAVALNLHWGLPSVAYCDRQGINYYWHLLDEAKLVIFTGGADINPAIYGQRNKYSDFEPYRDTAEIEVLRRALSMGKKLLGVCRGHQLINAYLGGDLVQDITTQLNVVHDNDHALEVLDAGGAIPNIFHEVNSIHHQGVVKPGEGLTPTTYWQGVYESCESEDIVTVQFHPEWMNHYSNVGSLSLWHYLDVWANLGLEVRV